MAKPIFSDLLHYLRVVCRPPGASDLTDAQMLERYLVHHEDAAFTLLVQRHGPMVLGVCRRVLGDAHGAEDSFQATFMVLLRRAGALRRAGSLGGWLYAVAQRIASKARLQAAARRNRERPLIELAADAPTNDCVWRDLRAVLDEEIVRLPKKFRAPIVLCYLQEKSYDQAARELGLSKSALARQLTRARELLRNQLVRRGVELTAAALATALCEKLAAAPVSALLTIKAVKAALASAGGKAVASSGISAGAIALAEEGMAAMPWVSGKVVGVLVAIGVVVGGVGWVGYRGMAEAQPIVKVQTQAQPHVVRQEEVLATIRKFESAISNAQWHIATETGSLANAKDKSSFKKEPYGLNGNVLMDYQQGRYRLELNHITKWFRGGTSTIPNKQDDYAVQERLAFDGNVSMHFRRGKIGLVLPGEGDPPGRMDISKSGAPDPQLHVFGGSAGFGYFPPNFCGVPLSKFLDERKPFSVKIEQQHIWRIECADPDEINDSLAGLRLRLDCDLSRGGLVTKAVWFLPKGMVILKEITVQPQKVAGKIWVPKTLTIHFPSDVPPSLSTLTFTEVKVNQRLEDEAFRLK